MKTAPDFFRIEAYGQDEIERVFEKFYRGRHGRAKVEGTGMGLSIAKGIIEAHGGKIHAESRAGGGAVAAVFFERAVPPGAADENAGAAPGDF